MSLGSVSLWLGFPVTASSRDQRSFLASLFPGFLPKVIAKTHRLGHALSLRCMYFTGGLTFQFLFQTSALWLLSTYMKLLRAFTAIHFFFINTLLCFEFFYYLILYCSVVMGKFLFKINSNHRFFAFPGFFLQSRPKERKAFQEKYMDSF